MKVCKPYSKVLILIVLHNGGKVIENSLNRALSMEMSEHSQILLIDNDSTDNSVEIAKRFISKSSRHMSLLRFSHNLGVAAAYNRGIEEADQRGASWLMILDQDSLPPTDLLKTLFSAATKLRRQGLPMAGVAPKAVNGFFSEEIYPPYRWNGIELSGVDLGSSHASLVPIDSTMTSGILYRVDALQDVGGFRDGYFIDFVDHECHIRLKNKGWQLWWCKSCQIVHFLGEYQKKIPHGIWVEHRPFRYYFMVRNMLEGHFRLAGIRGGMAFLKQLAGHLLLVMRYAERPFQIFIQICHGVIGFGE